MIIAAVAAVAAASLTAVPASAAVVDRVQYADSDQYTFTACDGVTIDEVDTWSGTFMLRQHGVNSPPYVFDNWQQDATITNRDTGRSWTAAWNSRHLDVKIDLVEGTIYRFTWQDAGTFKVFDGSGKLAYTQAGLFRQHALVDTKGNLDLGDDVFLEDLGTSLAGHYPGGDFCQDLVDFTTG
jgi:hypothetical protein